MIGIPTVKVRNRKSGGPCLGRGGTTGKEKGRERVGEAEREGVGRGKKGKGKGKEVSR